MPTSTSLDALCSQEEFESVKKESQSITDLLAPELVAPVERQRKRDRVVSAWRRAKGVVGIRKELREAAAELTAEIATRKLSTYDTRRYLYARRAKEPRLTP